MRRAAIEDFELEPGEARYDLALAVRVGPSTDGYPEAGRVALQRIAMALTGESCLCVDGGNPLKGVRFRR